MECHWWQLHRWRNCQPRERYVTASQEAVQPRTPPQRAAEDVGSWQELIKLRLGSSRNVLLYTPHPPVARDAAGTGEILREEDSLPPEVQTEATAAEPHVEVAASCTTSEMETEALALANAEVQAEAELEAHALSGLEAEVDSVPAAEVGDAAQGPAAAEATVPLTVIYWRNSSHESEPPPACAATVEEEAEPSTEGAEEASAAARAEMVGEEEAAAAVVEEEELGPTAMVQGEEVAVEVKEVEEVKEDRPCFPVRVLMRDPDNPEGPCSWLKTPSALLEDSAPSAFLDHRRAQAAPTHPRAQPEQLEGLQWPQELASGRSKVEESCAFRQQAAQGAHHPDARRDCGGDGGRAARSRSHPGAGATAGRTTARLGRGGGDGAVAGGTGGARGAARGEGGARGAGGGAGGGGAIGGAGGGGSGGGGGVRGEG